MMHPFIIQLFKDLSISEEPEASSAGSFLLSFTENLSLSIKPLDVGFYITSRLGQLPIKDAEEHLKTFLAANLFGDATGRAVIGLEEDEKWLTFSLAIPYQMTYNQFRDELENFINYLELWQDKLAEAATT
ncbi:MAG: type III secretion system chaperone [Parachlamydiales bacterium]|nr:type III secretion system chaperone [Parachlamydiales bacterium]